MIIMTKKGGRAIAGYTEIDYVNVTLIAIS